MTDKALRAGWASEASGIVLGIGLPLAMFFASRSATLMVTIAAVLAVLGVIQAGRLNDLARLVAGARAPLGIAGLAFLAFAFASLFWSYFPRANAFAYGEFVAAVAASVLLGASYSVRMPADLDRLLAIGIFLCAIATVADLTSDMWFRGALGLRPQNYVLNRTVVTILLLSWPMLLLAGGEGNSKGAGYGIAAAILLAGFALLRSESGASALGLGAGVACALLAWIAPRLSFGLLCGGSLVVLGLSPWIGKILEWVIPPKIHAALASTHSYDRVNIWSSFGAAVEQRPLFGSGFGSTARMAEDPVAQMVEDPFRVLLGAGHPHNALLQIWVELGAIGAALAAALLVLATVWAWRLRGLGAVIVAGLAGTVLSIAAVSHGAWQGWWIADVGAAIALIAAKLRETPHARL